MTSSSSYILLLLLLFPVLLLIIILRGFLKVLTKPILAATMADRKFLQFSTSWLPMSMLSVTMSMLSDIN